ncbi:glycosyltransferase [Bdellovibrio sp. HCB288]|uniref:glycosyltransferase n=1 Tax=Bdellovibrio sp. HCB288 TaxID=3394355 RepID=UPI0039B5B956
MRILTVNHTIDPVFGGGTAERTFELSQALVKSGYDCTILTLLEGESPRELKGGRIVRLPVCKFGLIPKYLFKGIVREVKGADVVHMMGHWTVLNALVYLTARHFRKPYVFCPAGALPIFGRSKFVKYIYNLLIGKSIVRNASRCIATTENEIKHFVSYGVSADQVLLIPNAIKDPIVSDINGNELSKKLGLHTPNYVLFLGRLNLIKGPDLLVAAFCNIMAEFPDVDLVMAGPDDGMLSELKATVKERRANDRIHFAGYIGGVEKFQVLKAALVLALPSRQEAMSLVVLEAGCVKTPTVFTDQCGLDKFAKADCGWMVPVSIEGLELGLKEALVNRESIRKKGERVFEFVQERYMWSSVVGAYSKMFRDLRES